MKKIILLCLLCASMLVGFMIESYSIDEKMFEEQLEASGAENLFDELPEETVEILEELGIDEVNFDNLFDPKLRNVFDLMMQIVRNEYTSPLSCFAQLAAFVILLAAASAFFSDDSKSFQVFRMASCSAVALSVVAPLSSCLTRAVSAIQASGNFMLALIPVLAAVITVSGNPVTALSYNSLSFAAAQLVSGIAGNTVKPLVQVLMSLGIISSAFQADYLSQLTAFIKKALVFILSLSATVFITMLTLKGTLSMSVDNAAVRGIRFVIGNMIPVVGGAVSDAYTSILGTLSLVKNTVGVFALVAIAFINIPTLVECIVWVAMLNFLGVIGDVFAQSNLSGLFRGISASVSLIAVILLFEMLVFLLSVGLILLMRGG